MPDLRNHIAPQGSPTPGATPTDAGAPTDTEPFVVVCAMRPRSELIDACLRALREDGAEPVVVIGADDLGRSAAGSIARSLGVSTIGVRGGTIAALHNAALATCASDTLALIDDDVAVEPGWFASLTEAWSRAPRDVAAIGGPLRLRVVGAQPRWWRREAEEAFATHDYGRSEMMLDPRRQTMHGGNLSFRCAALRGAEGFWPARGQGGARDWCSDEHAAQHALGALGWRSFYEPRAIAHRVIEAEHVSYRNVLARRFRASSRAAIADGPSARAGAPRRTLSSAVALATAPTRSGQRRRLMESSMELAANAGTLLAPLVAAHDFKPTEATPFRPFVPGLSPGNLRSRGRGFGASVRRGRRPVILVYHRVHPASPPGSECVSPAHFEEQLAVLRDRAELVSVGTIVAWARRGGRRGPGRATNMVAITFDDGYVDNLTYAAPLLEEFSAPATVFVATDHVESREPFFWDELELLLRNPAPEHEPALSLVFSGYPRSWLARTARERSGAREILQRLLQALSPRERASVLAQLRRWAGRPLGEATPARDCRPLTVEELQSLAAMPLIEIAAHTATHASLRFQSVETQRHELIRAREQLDSWLGCSRERGFAYPFGISGIDFDRATARLVREHGYAYAVSNDRGTVERGCDTYALPRLAVPDLDGERFARWLDDGP